MSAKTLSAAVVGLDAAVVEVEADVSTGPLGAFAIVGLPDLAVSEAKERVRMAIKNSGFDFPKRKVVVNLAPADIRKQGPSYDLPIAISILLATDKLRISDTNAWLFVGELALNGEVRPTNGILPMALLAQRLGIKTMVVPADNAIEAKLVDELEVIGVKSLRQLVNHLGGVDKIESTKSNVFSFENIASPFDMSHIQGQEHVKRAMEIAAAGGHNLLMSGPPGSGKTMIAKTMPSILPDLNLPEALEITKIYSIAGQLSGHQALLTSRPFRSPHHTASGVAMVGGGTWPRPGEISMAHRGVLFLDEFPEFPRGVLENLRQPLEDGIIHVSRAAGNLCFPAKFILIAAMNPCPCGYWGDPEKDCSCSPNQVANYRRKISGPIMDRIDLHIEVPRVKVDKLTAVINSEKSVDIKERVEVARRRQNIRFDGLGVRTNSEMGSELVRRVCQADEQALALLRQAAEQMMLSARSYFRILKVARTIADLSQMEQINSSHIAEALQYRVKTDVLM